jgi:hypothetical protein
MINQGNNVPDNTIAVFKNPAGVELSYERISKLIKKPERTRNWFDPNFYRCLPLVIGNTYGFVMITEIDFSMVWDGGQHANSLQFLIDGNIYENYPKMDSRFGNGVATFIYPMTFRTPSGVNLMTINPPNVIIPNVTVMTGIVESDNLRRDFSFNLKVQTPNVPIHFKAGDPIAGIIPIPRYYADKFELVDAEEIFDGKTVREEIKAYSAADSHRAFRQNKLPNKVGRHYFKGEDVYGNKFPDHQLPKD